MQFYSELGQDKVVDEFLKHKRSGYFVDDIWINNDHN